MVSGKVVGGRIPRGVAPRGVRKHLERQSAAQLHYELNLVVNVGRLLVECVAVAPVILVYVWAEYVSAHVGVEKRVHRDVVGQLQSLFQLAVLQLYEWFVAPLVAPEYPSREHLLGREAPVRATSVQFLGEVDGQRLQLAYPVVVQYVEPAEPVGVGLGQGGGCPCGLGGHGQQCRRAHDAAPEQRAAQQFAVGGPGVDEHPHERDEQQGVAGVSHGYAPRVGVDSQYAAPHVFVVRALV